MLNNLFIESRVDVRADVRAACGLDIVTAVTGAFPPPDQGTIDALDAGPASAPAANEPPVETFSLKVASTCQGEFASQEVVWNRPVEGRLELFSAESGELVAAIPVPPSTGAR